MSDAGKTNDPYTDGEVPADADISETDAGDSSEDDTAVSAEEAATLLPGGSRLDEGEDDPGLDSGDVRPTSGTATP